MTRRADPERVRAKDREKYHRDPEKERRLLRASRARHLDKRREYDKHRYWADPKRRAWQIKQANDWWQANDINRGKKNFMVARRRKRIQQATPPWLTKEQKKQIRDLYIEAAGRPGEWHVDHIYPLRAKNSCGLNVPWNLQIISGPDNRKKQNFLPGEVQL